MDEKSMNVLVFKILGPVSLTRPHLQLASLQFVNLHPEFQLENIVTRAIVGGGGRMAIACTAVFPFFPLSEIQLVTVVFVILCRDCPNSIKSTTHTYTKLHGR